MRRWGVVATSALQIVPPPSDVPSWLKSLRLHKYAALFSQMTYEEMMTLTEHHLESQNVTKGARHKIALSIQKLRERQSVLKALEKDILEGGNLWTALQELQQIMVTPIKAFRPPPAPPANGAHDGAPPGAADAFAPTQLPTLRPLQPPSPTETSQGSSLVSWAKSVPSCWCHGQMRRTSRVTSSSLRSA
ncbi:protein Smaug homolog 2 [Meleagris gallopavo]|uniref:protein Smaug homolog 2 n=1 Tax=Meleagris gallopavo TaxID=9103 RepID=UPI000549A7D5|nr:protein Smaug homolog 2 [Meleagris gallopavo]